MAVSLYPHNEKAFLSVLSFLEKGKKAAVVHPTGTGKSFIGFALADRFPAARICWLTPSSYIVKTQLENFRAVNPEADLENVAFLTYSKLAFMLPEEMAELGPDYIVLDEFHRCGAEKWGEGVTRLLQTFPQAKLLGLSATNIRYLDNQRDMAEELFDGCVASRMTLGEAVVRDILLPPTYVISVFPGQEKLRKYELRLEALGDKAVSRESQKRLDALRRALEQADGLPRMFQKHMRGRGRYIVFCSGKEHMEQMKQTVPEWLADIDPEPRRYSVYTESPEAEQEFARFKEDESGHLRLLFCIDMLNEGVHVEKIDGVIMLRPTISPIVYKQQLGRALSASKSRQPLVFDIVDNFENLNSIASLQKEMSQAAYWLREQGRGGEIVNERFQIVDEACDCRRLFEQLQESLSSGWDLYYLAAVDYRKEFGDLNVPKRYCTEDGLSLGMWLTTQRRVRQNKIPGVLTQEQIARLDALGFCWENRSEKAWKEKYTAACAYYKEHGDLDVPARYVSPEGVRLGSWLANLRQRKSDTGDSLLTPDQVAALDAIGMVWASRDYRWEAAYAEAERYYREHGSLQMRTNYITDTGFALDAWLTRQKYIYAGQTAHGTLSQEQIERLERLGICWKTRHDLRWQKSYEAASEYLAQHGNLDVPLKYKVRDISLRKWLYNQQQALRQPDKTHVRMTPERVQLLRDLGLGG